MATERPIKSFSFIFIGFCVNFKSTFTIKNLLISLEKALGEHLKMSAFVSMFYIATDYRIKQQQEAI